MTASIGWMDGQEVVQILLRGVGLDSSITMNDLPWPNNRGHPHSKLQWETLFPPWQVAVRRLVRLH